METSVTVIEAYLPDAAEHDGDWFLELIERANGSLSPYGLAAVLLILPEDESALWLITPVSPAEGRPKIPAQLNLPGLIARATASAGGHVIERQIDGRLVGPEAPDARPSGLR